MKKILFVLMCIFALMFGTGVVYAAELYVPEVEVNADESSMVTIPVSISDNSGFASFTININYDNSVLMPVSIEKTDMLNNGMFMGNIEFSDTAVRCAFASAYNTTGDGTIMNVVFSVNDGAAGEYEVGIECVQLSDSDNKDIEYNNNNGIVKIRRNIEVNGKGEMVDTAPEDDEYPAITSFYTVIDTDDKAVNKVIWDVSYDGVSNKYVQDYSVTFTGTVKLGLYIEDLYVQDKELLEMSVNAYGINKKEEVQPE